MPLDPYPDEMDESLEETRREAYAQGYRHGARATLDELTRLDSIDEIADNGELADTIRRLRREAT